ncbi:glycosyltransferase [Streptomyces sp. NBC_01462]|uniref:glycosyltransferase n=1 Tax=Streptomyces sp. NBC_01462 TaxID=2903876 RepID=UPI002E305398|nr:glycosyltransferase [Streptomyces sp. NBC_01462]
MDRDFPGLPRHRRRHHRPPPAASGRRCARRAPSMPVPGANARRQVSSPAATASPGPDGSPRSVCRDPMPVRRRRHGIFLAPRGTRPQVADEFPPLSEDARISASGGNRRTEVQRGKSTRGNRLDTAARLSRHYYRTADRGSYRKAPIRGENRFLCAGRPAWDGRTMRFLLSTIGSRGEVQPVVAPAVRLKEMGQDAVVCAPPDFRGWAESLGIAYVSVGPELRGTARRSAGTVPTPGQRRRMIDDTVAVQFEAVGAAAEGCDAVVAGGAPAVAARSVAERRGIGHAHAAFAPITLPSAHHAPPVFRMLGQGPGDRDPDRVSASGRRPRSWSGVRATPAGGEPGHESRQHPPGPAVPGQPAARAPVGVPWHRRRCGSLSR